MKIDPNKGNREWKVNPKKNTVTIYKVTKKGLIRHEIPKGHPDLDKIYGGSAKHLRNKSVNINPQRQKGGKYEYT